ncbi:hypothetical protein BBNG_00132 [Bifidobacterium bifidum NCIMB 41171]|nr:hypothetical protein BBNG_00132 [Bifidobacterium bifidum NCIMB 41171]
MRTKRTSAYSLEYRPYAYNHVRFADDGTRMFLIENRSLRHGNRLPAHFTCPPHAVWQTNGCDVRGGPANE